MRRETQEEFLANVGKVVSGEMNVLDFQRQVMIFTMNEFSVSMQYAAAHYLFAMSLYLLDNPEHKELLNPGQFLLDIPPK